MSTIYVAYLIVLTVYTTDWGSYTNLIPDVSLFCMLKQNQKEISALIIHFID